MPVPVNERALMRRINRRLRAAAKIDRRGIHGPWHVAAVGILITACEKQLF